MPARPLPRDDGFRRRRLARRAALGACVALAACGDGPGAPLPTGPLTLCMGSEWFAYRNEGGRWTRVRSSSGVYSFDATARLALASARLDPVSPFLRVEYVSAEQARAAWGCTTSPPTPPGTVSGTLQGLAAGDYVDVSYGHSHGSTSWTEPVFLLHALDGAHDFVATRFPTRVTADRVDRIVLRRAQSFDAGSSIAVDFASDEGFAPEEHAVRWSGPGVHLQVNFLGASGNDHLLQSSVVGTDAAGDAARSTTMLTMPAARVVAGDVHRVALGDGARTLVLYLRQPRDVDVTFGPAAGMPSFATVAVTPHVRVRAEVASQPEYGGRATLFLQQLNAVGTARLGISVATTREYFGGTPRTWSLEVPDLTGVDGWDDVVALGSGEYDWTLYVDSRSSPFDERVAADGDVQRSALASGRQRP